MTPDLNSIITPEIRACIGYASEVSVLPEKLASSDVRRYVEATGDTNPLWLDEEYARAAGHRGRVIPPLMIIQLYRWMRGKLFTGWENVPVPQGYTDVRNAGQEVEWVRPLYLGEQPTVQHRVVDIVAKEGRRTGVGIYLTRVSEFRNDAGEIVVLVRATSVRLPAQKYSEEPAPKEG
jgi:acyl dehydratase